MVARAEPTTATGLGMLAGLARRGAIAAAVAVVLASAVVGIELISSTGQLTFTTRFSAIGVTVVAVFFGSIAMDLLRLGVVWPAVIGAGAVGLGLIGLLVGSAENPALGRLLPYQSAILDWALLVFPLGIVVRGLYLFARARTHTTAAARPVAARRFAVGQVSGWAAWALIGCAVVMPFLPFADRRLVDIATLTLTYIMLGWGLNIVVGLAGLLDLGYVAFYAVGAYSYALLAVNLDLSFWVCLPLAGAFAASFGILLGFPVLRLRGDYLAIVTLGFGEMIRIVLVNWKPFTGGPDGINKIARPSFFGLDFERNPAEGVQAFHTLFGVDYSPMQRVIFLYFLILLCALVTN
ncbi:MAG: ABC transporter permease subunit, partial [Alphaproteobacteria bacterium]